MMSSRFSIENAVRVCVRLFQGSNEGQDENPRGEFSRTATHDDDERLLLNGAYRIVCWLGLTVDQPSTERKIASFRICAYDQEVNADYGRRGDEDDDYFIINLFLFEW